MNHSHLKPLLIGFTLLISSKISYSQNDTQRGVILDISSSPCIHLTLCDANYVAREKITLKAGFSFSASSGKGLHASINPTLTVDQSPEAPIIDLNSPDYETIDKSLKDINFSGSWSVSPTGASVFNLPIQLPQGINGLIPNIQVGYNSQGGIGNMGLGFSMSAIQSISRTTKSMFTDGKVSAIQFSKADEYAFNGQRLIHIAGTHSEVDAEYRTEMESFMKVMVTGADASGPTTFIVSDNNGMFYEFGYGSSKVVGSNNVVLSWNISRIRDSWGNYIQYNYETEEGELILRSIDYTGNVTQSLAPINKVEFVYDFRKDKSSGYVYGNEFKTNHILTGIRILTSGELIWNYSFSYSYFNNIQRVNKIELSNGKAEKLNPILFDWKVPEAPSNLGAFSRKEVFAGTNLSSKALFFSDFDGDGFTDVVVADDGATKNNFKVGLSKNSVSYNINNTTNFALPPKYKDFRGDSKYRHTAGKLFSLDLLGDGRNWIIMQEFLDHGDQNHTNDQMMLTPMTFFIDGSGVTQKIELAKRAFVIKSGTFLFEDFNADGSIELLEINTDSTSLLKYHSNGSITSTPITPSLPFITLPKPPSELVDIRYSVINFNGNSKPDLMILKDNGFEVFELNDAGNSFMKISSKIFDFIESDYHHIIGDLNGDGLSDILYYNHFEGKTYIAYNTGVDFILKSEVDLGVQLGGPDMDNRYIFDINEDGKNDIVEIYGQSFYYHLNTGIQSFQTNSFPYSKDNSGLNSVGTSSSYWHIMDLDRDGKQEFYYYGFSNQSFYKIGLFENRRNAIAQSRDGFKNLTRLSYKQLGNYELREQNEIDYGSNYSYLYRNLKVCTLLEAKIDGVFEQKFYSFFNALVHKQRGFLGFLSYVENDKLTKRTSTTYQNVPQISWNNSQTLAYPMLSPFKTEVKFDNADVLSRSTVLEYKGHIFNINKKHVFFYPSSSKSEDFIGGISSTQNQNISSLGNPLSTETIFANDSTIKLEYKNYVKAGGFDVNKPTTITRTVKKGNSTIARDTYFEYNATTGSLSREIKFNNLSNKLITSYLYNGYGLPYQITSFNRTKFINYDNTFRFIKSEENALGHEVKYTHDRTTGLLLKKESVNGITEQYEYDSWFRNTKTYNSLGEEVYTSYAWSDISANNALTMSTVWDNTGGLSKEYYNIRGNVVYNAVKDFAGQMVFKKFDYKQEDYYQLSEESEAYFYGKTPATSNTYEYDPKTLKLKKTKDYFNNVTTTTIGAKSVTSEGYGKTTKVHLNSFGEKHKVIDNQSASITYTYDADGNMLSATSPAGIITSMTYDEYGYQKTLTDPSSGITKYEYNQAGELTKQTDANNLISTFVYDALGRLQTKTFPEGTISYEYDNGTGAKGKLRRVSHSGTGNSIAYTYDVNGRMLTEVHTISGKSYTYAYEYDEYNRLKRKTLPGSVTIDYYYNFYGALYKEVLNSNHTIYELQEVNADGQITKLLKADRREETFAYTNKQLSHHSASTLLDFYYNFEKENGNLNQRRMILYGLNSDYTEKFTYDGFERLLGCTLSVGQTDYTSTMEYTQDNTGNIKSKSDVGTYNYGSSPFAVSHISDFHTDIPKTQQDITYNSFQQPVSITQDDYTLTYTYGVDEQRIRSKFTKGSTTLYEKLYLPGLEVDVSAAGTDTRLLYYLSGPDGLTAMYALNTLTGLDTLYSVYTDYLGSIRRVTDEQGNIIHTRDYDAWGRPRNPYDFSYTNINPHPVTQRGYTGHEHIVELGLINMNGRMYDPLLGRMLSPDNFVQDDANSQNYNRYSYVLNNPLKYTDPSGEFIWIIPSISWSKQDGLGLGVSLVVGLPGMLSAQTGINYSTGSNDFSAYVGISAAFNTVSASYSGKNGFSYNYSVGATPYSGLPISSNIFSVGVSYNVSNNQWSSNAFGFQWDNNGRSFNPSVSAMVLPEHTTNLVRGQGFRSNNGVLNRFVANNNKQGALDYFGFEGTYDPNHEYYKKGSGDPAFTDNNGNIHYGDNAFNGGYDKLSLNAAHEMQHRKDYLSGKYSGTPSNSQLNEGEYNAWVHNYKNQGLYRNHGTDIRTRIAAYGSKLDNINLNRYSQYSYSVYSPSWHIIYKVPRKW